MGTAKNRSWSFSRDSLYKTCPRAFFFQYYPWGEPDQQFLAFHKRVTTTPMMVGQIVHDTINIALRSFMANGFEMVNLQAPAVIVYDGLLKESLRTAKVAKSKKRPPGSGPVLSHHLDGEASATTEDAGRSSLIDSLTTFESSEAWKYIRSTNPRTWYPIHSNTENKSFFETSTELGFARSSGLRVYTVHDLAFRDGDNVVIVDWKTGRKTPSSAAAARRQVTAYALWAVSKDRPLDTVRIQPYFLDRDEKWDPQPVTEAEVERVRQQIEEHVKIESALVDMTKDRQGNWVYVARREDFPAKPRESVCLGCKFRAVCKEGLAVGCQDLALAS